MELLNVRLKPNALSTKYDLVYNVSADLAFLQSKFPFEVLETWSCSNNFQTSTRLKMKGFAWSRNGEMKNLKNKFIL